MSIAGGLHLAFERAVAAGCDCMQVFVKNQRQWKARPQDGEQIREWKEAQSQSEIAPVIAHDTYLINLAAPDDGLWRKSIDAFVDELQRCEQLGITGLVTHPGAHCGRGEEWGIQRIARALDIIHERESGFKTRTLLEVTAGQGSGIGYRFEHIGEIMQRTRQSHRLAVCLDTCHLFAAGYDVSKPAGYESTIAALDQHVGVSNVMCIHTNDSRKPLGSRVDRHDHIGEGLMTLPAFRHFVNDPRFFGVPMILETEKSQDSKGRDWDRVNLARLRRLIRRFP